MCKLERYEWCDFWWEEAENDLKPRVLLIGDSITRGYRQYVNRLLKEIALVDMLATSRAVDNPALKQEIDYILGQNPVGYQVVHFNNGLHGFHVDNDDYKIYLEDILLHIKNRLGHNRIILATSTPVLKQGSLNELDSHLNSKVLGRNTIVQDLANKHQFEVNDLYASMYEKSEYRLNDGFHFNNDGQQAQAGLTANVISCKLNRGKEIYMSDYNKTKLNENKPEKTVKLAFIHHSCGSNWLNDENGGLGKALMENNYFVSSTNYHWGPDEIGSYTDIGHWWKWFRSSDAVRNMDAVYKLNEQNCSYSRPDVIPEGENEIIIFKSCYPNSIVKGNADEPIPDISENPLKGIEFNSEFHTLSNAKSIYSDILNYFRTRQDKLFILVTPPPIMDGTWAKNARILNNWLVYEWLKDYEYKNVAVFDLYNVLTSNGGSPDESDVGSFDGNHHRYLDGKIQHKIDEAFQCDTLKYPASPTNNHPSRNGNMKATAEFIPLLNVYYNLWKKN
jgi:Lysophospholipase L1 and related esterases